MSSKIKFPEKVSFLPLDEISIDFTESGIVVARDGEGREYFREKVKDKVLLAVSGSVGTHQLDLLDETGKVLETFGFRVECETKIEDEGGKFSRLLDILKYTMTCSSESSKIFLGGKFYRYYVCWLRDHVHSLKGMKYFDCDELKSAVDLYDDYQRSDGMIWDRIEKYGPHSTWRDMTFSYGDFVMEVDKDWRFERIPVENDVEYLFIEGIYYTWKATGDDEWMKAKLDSAMKAFNYSTSNKYRWSEKFGLLKRAYTIDTWDFMSSFEASERGGSMCFDPEMTVFGLMHGDNTGFAASCSYLSEMLEVAGRDSEAAEIKNSEIKIRDNLNKLSWNGKFFTHHVSENPSFERDFGVNTDRQLSLSNAYALNRGISHEQCVEIIKSYQKIRKEMPNESPGEFYQIFPSFEKGFGGHNSKWEYMNGGVTTIVAGELAHGAFEHGFEEYGADILSRMLEWAESYEGYLHCTQRGGPLPDNSGANFKTIDLKKYSNVNFSGIDNDSAAVPWLLEGENDLSQMPIGSQSFQEIDFEVANPDESEGRACIGLSSKEEYFQIQSLEIDSKARSIYFLQTMAGNGLAGLITLEYDDGAKFAEYVESGKNIDSWFMPPEIECGGNSKPKHENIKYRLAWRGKNSLFDNVGVQVFGLDNPCPNKKISKITFEAAENLNVWMVIGVTLSDKAAVFPRNMLSFGIPDIWGAGAVVYALLEGLCGIKDDSVNFQEATLSPRWLSSEIEAVKTAVTYPHAGGYVAYDYHKINDRLVMKIASSAEKIHLKILLPKKFNLQNVKCNSKNIDFKIEIIENSNYAVCELCGISFKKMEIIGK